MQDHDVAVATPPNNEDAERPDRSIAEQLVEQARTDGVDLVGPGGLLSNLTKLQLTRFGGHLILVVPGK